MERTVIFRDRQELQSADLNNIETFARDSIDHIVVDAIEPLKKYSGFSASKTSATQITVAPGRLYAAGLVYARDENTVLDTFNTLPLVTKKRVAIVSWGQAITTDVQPRDFLIDAQTGQTEPQSVAMEGKRYAEINLISGVEAADPQYPATDANVLVLAYALLDTNGVVSIEPVTANQLSNLSLVNTRTGALEDWRGAVGSRLNSLSTDLAALANRLGGYALLADVTGLSSRITEIEAELAKPRPPVSEFAGFWEEFFVDDAGSDPEFSGYSAAIDFGLRFGLAASATSTFSLLNPTEPTVFNYSGFLLPKFDNVKRIETTGYDGEIDITTDATYATTNRVQKTRTVRKVKVGYQFPPMSRSRSDPFWDRITVDAATRTFSFAGVTFAFAPGQYGYTSWLYPAGELLYTDGSKNSKVDYYPAWVGEVDEPYWENVTTTTPTNGNVVAQTFLWSQTAWVSQIGLFFSRVGPSGGVTVLLTETTNNKPDLSRVVGEAVLNREDIIAGTVGGSASLPPVSETRVSFTPVLLKAGRRYAVVIVTAGTHFLATSSNENAVLNGSLYRTTSSAGDFTIDLGRDLKLNIYSAQFRSNLVSVEFNPFQLAGGISNFDIKAQTITPSPTSLSYEVYDGGKWVSTQSSAIEAVMAANPAVLRVRAVFSGTSDLMPGMSINPSEVSLLRHDLSMTWVSAVKEPMSTAEKVTVSARMYGLDADHNSIAATLLHGSTYTSVETADVVETVVQPDGSHLRTWTFSGISPGVSAYRVKLSATTDAIDKEIGLTRLSGAEFNVA